jgi:hypothetical protein
MNIKVVERTQDVKSYGDGSLGGKGAGLVKINDCLLPQASKLKTWILTTSFYDRFLELDRKFGEDELKTVASILAELGDIPVGVRSSATNEAGISPEGICFRTIIPISRRVSIRWSRRSTISTTIFSRGSSQEVGRKWPL